MSQNELDRDLARATGESARRIRRMGFTLVVVPDRVPGKEVRKSVAEQTARVARTPDGVAGRHD